MSEGFIDLPPDVHLITSIRADRGSWAVLAAEGIDNAFDADATTISLTLTRAFASLQDNGVGITHDREDAILRLGEHRGMVSTRLGMFGIGIKYHAVSAGDIMEVDSVSRDGRLRRTADWEAILRQGAWRFPRPIWTPALRGASTGTTIIIKKLRWPAPKPIDIEKASDYLAQTFYPALAEGRTILVNDEPVPVLAEPSMTDIIEGDVRLSSGKGAHVRAGLTVGLTPLYQVQVSYGHRVIESKSGFGCGSYTGLRRMFGRVHLSGPWALTRFKDRVIDEERGDLEERIEELIRPILEQCQTAHMTAELDEVVARLNELLPPDLVAVRPDRRPDKERVPGINKKRHRQQHRPAVGETTPTGPARAVRPAAGRVLIEFSPGLNDEFGYGRFVPGRPSRIQLAQDNPHIASFIHERDKAVGVQILYDLALMLYQQAKDAQDLAENKMGRMLDMPFGKRVWDLASRQKLDQTGG